MRIDLLEQQRLIVQLPGGDELHLIDTTGSTTLEHHPGHGPVYSLLLPSSMTTETLPAPLQDEEVQLEIPDLEEPPAELETDQARLFF